MTKPWTILVLVAASVTGCRRDTSNRAAGQSPGSQQSAPSLDTASPQPAGPAIPENVVAGTRIVSATPLTTYHGPFRLLGANAGKLTGAVNGQPVEIWFRVPAMSQELSVHDSALTLVVEQDTAQGSTRRMMALSNREGLVLFDLSGTDGHHLYARDFKSLSLGVKQAANGVNVSYAGQHVLIPPGDTERLRDRHGGVAIFLLENGFPPAATELTPYHVRVVSWRVE